jgi:hypothetical protein
MPILKAGVLYFELVFGVVRIVRRISCLGSRSTPTTRSRGTSNSPRLDNVLSLITRFRKMCRRREVLKTSVRALLSVAVPSREERFNGNRNQQNSLSPMEHGKVEIGAEILLRISREFGKSIEWLLTG